MTRSPTDPIAWAPTTPAADPDKTLDVVSGEIGAGYTVGRFVIKKRLGEGGMGVVYEGVDADLGRPVALKLLRGAVDHPAYRARLLREAQAMARLEHANVVRVYEVGTANDRLYVAMELVDGVTLGTWLKVQRRNWREIVAMFRKVGAGLAAVHRVGLVHRDFKPDNVLVDRDGSARVADFGLAFLDRSVASATSSPELAASLTRTGALMGTPGYMAPEQQFAGDVDARADQYSFCVALREALLGGRPKQPDESSWAGTPRSLRQLIARGLSYEPEGRFRTMDELLAALERVSARRLTIVGAVLAPIVAAGAIAAVWVLARPGEPPESGTAKVAEATKGSADSLKGSADSSTVSTGSSKGSAAPADSPSGSAARAGSAAGSADSSTAGSAAPAKAADATKLPAKIASPPKAKVPSKVATRDGAAPPAPPTTTTLPVHVIGSPATYQGVPEAQPDHPGHLAIVRQTIAGLGWDGFDPNVTGADIDTLDDKNRAIARVKLGMVARKRGDCSAATAAWRDAVKQLKFGEGDEGRWQARGYLGLALCALAAGSKDAGDLANHAWVFGNQEQDKLVIALATYERDEKTLAHGLFISASMVSDPAALAALKTWLTLTGLAL